MPDRGTPDHGELNYTHIFKVINEMGYEAPLGAEYLSPLNTDDTLEWMKIFASS